MSTWDRTSYYFSGQGVVEIGERDSVGKPKGLVAMGNVSALRIPIETSVTEHKEAQSGQRGIDLRLVTETKATLSVTVENFIAENLMLALRGDQTAKKAGSVVAEALKLYNGKILPLANLKVSSVLIKRGATTLTAYTNDATAHDYKLNTEAGSIKMNDGAVTALGVLTTGGTAPSAITVGNPTVVTVANTAVVGDYVAFSGFTGADAALVNLKAHKITVASSTSVSIDLDTTGKTITLGTPLSAFDGVALTADYSYAAQYLVNALTVAAPERYLRFEGLNTADGNNPVVVEVFKFSISPTAELALISGEEIASFELTGNVLADPLQASGSQYFRQTLLR